jgi:hypothetical protein
LRAFTARKFHAHNNVWNLQTINGTSSNLFFPNLNFDETVAGVPGKILAMCWREYFGSLELELHGRTYHLGSRLIKLAIDVSRPGRRKEL